ncbi:ABC transporter permease [Pollutimonas bauzanensis]|uniref:Sulfonate transport system permease protein n=1 Tax=Pollutimonas bauzanensis TaxID=658167 RepID=A0A1M5TAF3_9BURK|nr:ABC transporter permease [Pollutimonas bauzanensis]SHH47658.1 sulfonate transport system permease protein [Pollutimonas bauzanensis]
MSSLASSTNPAAAAGIPPPLRTREPGRWRGFVLPVAAIALWWAASALDLVNSALLVSPVKVWDTAVDQLATGKIWLALGASLARELTGFAIGTTAGLALGGLLGFLPLFNRIVGPSFNTFKQISLFAWIPLISVWFGLGDVAKVVFLSLAALVPVVVNTCDGIRNAPESLLEVARVYGFTRWQTIAQVVLPAALPAIFTGVYLALIYSWLATIGAEYLLVAGQGIGNTLIEGSEHFRMDLVIFGMFIIGLVGWLMNASARIVERRIARWRGN